MADTDGKYYSDVHDSQNVHRERCTDGYLLLWEDHGEVRLEGALAPELVQRLVSSALSQAVKDKLQGFLTRRK